MTDSERAEFSARIARQERVDIMCVAGVLSNLTRGTYGSFRNLLRKRRQWNNSNSASA